MRVVRALEVEARADRGGSAVRATIPRIAAGTLANACCCRANLGALHSPQLEHAIMMAAVSTKDSAVADIMSRVLWWVERTRKLACGFNGSSAAREHDLETH